MEQLQQTKQNPMANASLILSGLAILFAFRTPVYALFFGCLSILFANLSKGSGLKMPDKALIGFIISIIGIIVAILLFMTALYLQQYLSQNYGIDIRKDPEAFQKLLMERMDYFLNQLEAGGNGL